MTPAFRYLAALVHLATPEGRAVLADLVAPPDLLRGLERVVDIASARGFIEELCAARRRRDEELASLRVAYDGVLRQRQEQDEEAGKLAKRCKGLETLNRALQEGARAWHNDEIASAEAGYRYRWEHEPERHPDGWPIDPSEDGHFLPALDVAYACDQSRRIGWGAGWLAADIDVMLGIGGPDYACVFGASGFEYRAAVGGLCARVKALEAALAEANADAAQAWARVGCEAEALTVARAEIARLRAEQPSKESRP